MSGPYVLAEEFDHDNHKIRVLKLRVPRGKPFDVVVHTVRTPPYETWNEQREANERFQQLWEDGKLQKK